MGLGCESGSRFFCRALSRIMDRMDETIEHIEKTLQAEAAPTQTEGATAYADAARASDAVGFEREDAERTLSLTVSYNGGPFCGFARQPGKLTVQGELEQVLSLVMRRPVEVVCSGRTDAGVHALGQVISFNVSAKELESRSLYSLRRSLNALTHEDITVRKVEERDPGFSARFDAQWREYHYHICLDDTPPLFMRDLASCALPGRRTRLQKLLHGGQCRGQAHVSQRA